MDQQEINKYVDNDKIIVCCDIDGTLFDLDFPDGILSMKPRWEVIRRIRFLYERGDYIIFYTGRPENKREITEEQLEMHNIPYHELVMGKPRAHLYIDDSTVDVEDYIRNPRMYEEKYRAIGNQINKKWRNK